MSNFINKILYESRIFLVEAKNLGTLYHFTSVNSIEKILEENKLRPHAQTLKNEKEVFGCSLTRDKFFHKTGDRLDSGVAGISARISLNGNKISERYKIFPFNWFYVFLSTSEETRARGDYSESEELVVTSEQGLTNLKNYILEISILKNIEKQEIDRIKKICTKHKIKFKVLNAR